MRSRSSTSPCAGPERGQRGRRPARPGDDGRGAVPRAVGHRAAYPCRAVAVSKLLVANRGEIALRVFRTARRLGIATVAVAPPDDTGALHARSADQTIDVTSYLDAANLLR